MPHIYVEYPAHFCDVVDIEALLSQVHNQALENDELPTAAIRVRGVPRSQYRVADGNPDHGFLHLLVRLKAGRSRQVRQDIGQEFLALLNAFFAAHQQQHGLAISVEIQEIDTDFNFANNNIGEFL